MTVENSKHGHAVYEFNMIMSSDSEPNEFVRIVIGAYKDLKGPVATAACTTRFALTENVNWMVYLGVAAGVRLEDVIVSTGFFGFLPCFFLCVLLFQFNFSLIAFVSFFFCILYDTLFSYMCCITFFLCE